MRPILAAFLLCAAFGAPAQEKGTEIEAGFSRERLSGGRADWTSGYLEGVHAFAPRQALYGGVRRTERFDLRDDELWAGYSHPLSARLTATVEGSHSSDPDVLPASSIYAQLAWASGSGWVLSAGARHVEYTRSDANVLVAGVERYWGSFRAAYTLYNGRPEGAGSATAHRATFDYYYGEHSRVGVGVTGGREVENVGPPAGVVTTDVRNAGVFGRHWLTPAWALTYDLVAHRQGELYRRGGVRLGLRHRF